MRAGVRLLSIANPPAPRIGELQAPFKTWFVERLRGQREQPIETARSVVVRKLSVL